MRWPRSMRLSKANCQRADAAAETGPDVADPSVELGMELDQNGDGQPEILDATAQDIALGFVDIMEHVQIGIAGNRLTTAAREPAKTGKQHRRLLDRNVEIRLVAPAIAMADDEAAPDGSLSRQQQPAADWEFIGRGIGDVMDAPVRMAGPAGPEPRLRIHGERADMARAPKVIEAGRRLGRSYRAKLVDAQGRRSDRNQRGGLSGCSSDACFVKQADGQDWVAPRDHLPDTKRASLDAVAALSH